ncbi:MAG TPA: four helix bundle protein [Ignavibacteria bacterium]|nr:four helix bundle protein [Ignavibacteria bacterium]HMQ99993.1 four helix bundle protein [Ignavibacteria bacterium]
MKENVVLEKSYSFAVNTIIAVRSLNKTIDTYVLVKQLLRAGTSVGANIEESQGGYSKKDFKHKLNVAYKEARECKYWIRLIIDTQISTKQQIVAFQKLLNDADELCKIIYSIVNSTK